MTTRNFVPRNDNEGTIGIPSKKWSNVLSTLINNLSMVAQTIGFTISGGTTSKTLTVDETVNLSDKANKVSRVNYITNQTLTNSNCSNLFTNTGSESEVILTLPSGEDGLRVTALVTENYLFSLKASSNDTIRYLGMESILGGKITCDTVDHMVQLDWSGTAWVASVVGSQWQLEVE